MRSQYKSSLRFAIADLSFATFRVHSLSRHGGNPGLGRWLQVDPKAEGAYKHTPYNSMWNNPISYSDFNGDTPVHVGAAILGAGYNIYNNWSSIVKNPWSAVGYGLTGAAAGAVSVGNPAAARLILAGGNIATDAAFGNLPDLTSLSDVGSYAGKLTMDAIAVGGSGAMAKTINNTLRSVGTDAAVEGIVALSGEKQAELLQEYTLKGMTEVDALAEITNMKFGGSINIIATRTYTGGISTSLSAGFARVTIAETAKELKKINGPNGYKNRIEINTENYKYEIDLDGPSHNHKGEIYETPHTKISPRNRNAPGSERVYNTTKKHVNYEKTSSKQLRWVRRLLKGR